MEVANLRPTMPWEITIGPHALVSTVSEARLACLLDTAVDGIVVLDESASILVSNKACERLFGYAAGENLSRNIKKIVRSEDADESENLIPDYLCTGAPEIVGGGRAAMGCHRDGTQFPIALSTGESVTPDGRQFIGILRDLREHHPTEQRLNQLQAYLFQMARVSSMDEMNAALAHEISQPLTALMLYIQAVERATLQASGMSVPQSAVVILEKAMHEAERAGRIIAQMRRFATNREPIRRAVDLNALIEDAIQLILLNSPQGIEITRLLAPKLPSVIIDPMQIQQVVIDLSRYVLAAATDQDVPRARIGTNCADGVVVVDVEDVGPGISAATTSELFQEISPSSCPGHDLNLALSKSIAQNHGGDVIVDCGRQGRGARFTLRLPQAPEPWIESVPNG
jgi:two-component system, LuxR family, sensor kinase FixL